MYFFNFRPSISFSALETFCVYDIYRTVGYINLLFSQAGHSVLILITQLLLLRSKKGKSYSITLFFEIAFSCRITSTIAPGWLFSWLQKVLRNNKYLIGSINSSSRLIMIEHTFYATIYMHNKIQGFPTF